MRKDRLTGGLFHFGIDKPPLFHYNHIIILNKRCIVSANFMKVFSRIDLKSARITALNEIELTLRTNKKTGEKIARAVLGDGRTLVKTVTASGVVSETVHTIPEILSTAQRKTIIKDLAKQRHTQEEIAAMLNISQSLVSKVLKKK